MLCLSEQVGRHQFSVGSVVSDHRNLRWTREQVDCNGAKELSLGLGNVGIAGTDEHVNRRLPEKTESHGRQGLHAPEHKESVDSGYGGRVSDGGIRSPTRLRGGARDHRRDASHLRDPDSHERAGSERKTTRGQIGADASHWYVTLTCHQSGKQFGLEIAEVLALQSRELLGAFRAEVDGSAKLGIQGISGSSERARFDFEVEAAVAVQAQRELADGIQTVGLDFQQHPAHGGSYRRVPLGFGSVQLWRFQLDEPGRVFANEPSAEFHTSEPAGTPHLRQRRLVVDGA